MMLRFVYDETKVVWINANTIASIHTVSKNQCRISLTDGKWWQVEGNAEEMARRINGEP